MLHVQNVSKSFPLYNHPLDRLKALLPFSGAPPHRDFWALRDINFSVERGEFLGLVGPNGCGKSTLLQVISGVLRPTSGRILSEGRIAALLELGAGFNPEFSGRDNVYLNGEILGLSRGALESAMPRIEAFAGIGDFIDRPVKEYSSGMYVRLAFSTAIHVDPEILIVDEALAVGDAAFANKCIRKFEELKKNGVTVLFVSHDLGLVKQLAHRAVFLSAGRMEALGSPKEVIDRYIGTVLERQAPEAGVREQFNGVQAAFRHGDASSEVVSVAILDDQGQATAAIVSGATITVRVRTRFHRAQADPMVGILIRTQIGIEVYGTNTRLEGLFLGNYAVADEMTVAFRFACWLTPQPYTLTVATQHSDGSSHDWLDDVLTFEVIGQRHAAGFVDLQAAVSFSRKTT